MTHDEAVAKLNQLRSFFVDGGSMTQALDIAIAALERPASPGKPINHSGNTTGMVTQFDERMNGMREHLEEMGFRGTLGLLADMQAHIRKLQDILRELVELRHIKTTLGKTPEYLERQPKAWARAEEAVK